MNATSTPENVEIVSDYESTESNSTVAESPTSKLSFANMVQAFNKAVAGGQLTKQQAANMRRDMGISNSFFTRKKMAPAKRKRINKLAKAARKVTTQKGFSGQKMTKGHR